MTPGCTWRISQHIEDCSSIGAMHVQGRHSKTEPWLQHRASNHSAPMLQQRLLKLIGASDWKGRNGTAMQFRCETILVRSTLASSPKIYRYCIARTASGMLAVVAHASALAPGTNLPLFLAQRSLVKARTVLLERMELDSHG